RLSRAQVTDFASVNYAEFVDVDLMAEVRVVERFVVLLDQIVDILFRQDADVVLQIFVALFGQFGRLFQQLGFFPEHLRLLFAKVIEHGFKLIVFQLLSLGLAVVAGNIDGNQLVFLRLDFVIEIFLPKASRTRSLGLERDDHKTSTLVLKRIGDRVKLRLNVGDFLVDLCDVALNFIDRSGRFVIKLLIFGRGFYFFFGLPGVLANAAQVSGVPPHEFALNRFPRPLTKALVIKRPAGAQHQQHRADQNDRAGGSADDRIALPLRVLLYQGFDRFRRIGHSL